jgi:formylglycine-generating enzyme required for sulfatase activity
MNNKPHYNGQEITPVDTAYVHGNVETSSGDFNGHDQYIHGDVVGGDKVRGDKLTVHDIREAQGVAIGAGAQAIVNEIINNITQQALSVVDEADKLRANALRILAENVRDYVQRLTELPTQKHDALQGGPYRGLIVYTLADTELFCGRRRAIVEVLEQMGANRLTVLQSKSGAGKSSLLQAGIAPQLILNGHLPVILRPYDLSPSLKIKQTFLTGLEKHAEFQAASLRSFLHQVTRSLGQSTTLYVVLDPFEEFFTLLKGDAQQTAEQMRASFVHELADCLEDLSLNVRWVLAVRSEFFGDLASFWPRLRNPFENHYRLNRLMREEAKEVITEPAVRYQIEFEPTLVTAILADLQQPDGQIAPPQLQLVCQALYQAFREAQAKEATLPSIITLAMYEQKERAKGILGRYLHRVLSRTLRSKAEQNLARRLLIELVSSTHRRLRLTHSELAQRLTTTPIAPQSIDAVLKNLVDTHLLIVEQQDDDNEATYELAHDYLLGEIRVDPTVQAQKAAQELLQQEVEAYQRFQTLLSKEKFAIINSQRTVLVLDEKAKELLTLSDEAIHQEERKLKEALQGEVRAARRARNRSLLALAATAAALILTLIIGLAELEKSSVNSAKGQANEALRDAQDLKRDLDIEGAIAKVQEAVILSNTFKLNLDIDLEAEIAEILHYVAAGLVQEKEGEKLDAGAAIKVREAITLADAFAHQQKIDLSPRIAETRRYVAASLVQQGEAHLREANILDLTEQSQQVIIPATISATALFLQALALNPPSDTPLYVWIPSGAFIMGSTEAQVLCGENQECHCGRDNPKECEDELPQRKVNIGGFWIMRTEVTNEQYKRCVEANVCHPPNNERWKLEKYSREPVTDIRWAQANRYAAWVGGRLPTEAEWEKACRGMVGHIYPWGNENPNAKLLNFQQSKLNNVVNVGTYPPGFYGLYDMVGNAWEWMLDVYSPGKPVVRGGAFHHGVPHVRCAGRDPAPKERDEYIGFRVVALTGP